MASSPYLAKDDAQRLQDVMTAIQVMGTYKWDSRSVQEWASILGEPLSNEKNWKRIFEQHPEFFGIEPSEALGKKMYLRWRRAYEQTYDPDNLRELTVAEKERILAESPDKQDKWSRTPLKAEQIGSLLTLAIELHARASASAERKRWWIILLVSPVVGLLGVILGALLT
jgi:hypothetical protein